MRHLMIVMLVLMAGTVCRAAETKADFSVSISGSDSWSGTLATPNAQGSDGPFVTLKPHGSGGSAWIVGLGFESIIREPSASTRK